ncbi:MAG: molybdopterin molybdotransferase MoeA, partial [Nitrososphaera sp.]
MNGSEKYTPVHAALEKFLFYHSWSKLPLPLEYVSLIDAQNRVLAKNLLSPINVPPFLRAIMDGYAIKSNDTKDASNKHPVLLEIIGRIAAGQDRRYKVKPGKAVAIATGARIPEDADAVIMVENTERENGKVKVFKEINHGANISLKGEDVKKGQVLLRKGTWLTPQDVGLAASLGINKVPVFKRPRVAIFST